jgi:hypothetical protein
MILHTADKVAFFMYQVAELRFAVHFAQTAPDPEWKSILQIAQGIIPVAGGVWIAWMAFGWNKKETHRQWVRDQSKAEWKEILVKVAGIEHDVPVIYSGMPEHKDLAANVIDVLPLLRGTVFIYPALESSGFIDRWESLVTYVSDGFMSRVEVNRAVQAGKIEGAVTDESKLRWKERSREAESEIRIRLHRLIRELREIAHGDLGLRKEQGTGQSDT